MGMLSPVLFSSDATKGLLHKVNSPLKATKQQQHN